MSCHAGVGISLRRGWDLAEEEVDFSLHSLFVVFSFVVVVAVAVVAVG
jgi:hypothetical protein